MFGLVALDSDGLDLWDLSGLTSSVYFDWRLYKNFFLDGMIQDQLFPMLSWAK